MNICNTDWTIFEQTFMDDECDGECDFDSQTIKLKKALCHHRKGLALTHELLHVIFDFIGVSDDEELVSRLEHHIYDLIKKFPEEYK